jgi:dynactin complex subunit
MKTKTGRTGPIKATTPFGDAFRTSKKDKRQIKHATLMSKIAKSSKTQKKRRPSKKLVANLESLADALPDAADNSHDAASQVNIIKQKTLRHKPGAMKRREKLEKVERDRFAKNLAQMASIQPAAAPAATGDASEALPESNPTANRWSALRNFISQTMEQQPVFKTNK